uniref:Short-chain dehydrogenase n=1 Tax=Riptortus pedestris TaxID=329032 RepID=R4WCI7_RIPPE|nr:hypothetical protein [Riptortus pedestris]
MMDRWVDKVAVVTGASSGIGDAIARRLAKDGLKVAALARRADRLQALEREVKESGARGLVKGYTCDVTSESDVDAVFKKIEKDLGPVHILVNNAGVSPQANLTDMDLANAKVMIDTNITAVLSCTKAAIASMKPNAAEGHIINISSIYGHLNQPMSIIGLYSATKHALNILSVTTRSQLKAENIPIRLTTVSPGLVKSEMSAGFVDHLKLGQYVLAEDIADSVAFAIASPSHVNISDIRVEPVSDFKY